MKTKGLAICLSALLAASTAQAESPPGPATSTPKPPAAPDRARVRTEAETAQTGFHIKRTIKRNGRITDAPTQLLVIDRATIERSGARDLAHLLGQQGMRR